MRILGLCFDTTSPGVPHGHEPGLVFLSFVIAAFASYCSLDMAERLRAAEGRGRVFWLGMSGLTLGAGIWSMHFVAMTAFDAPLEQGYEIGPTLFSGLIAVVAVIAGLAAMGRKPSIASLLAGGAVVGAGVVAMHYVGMSALDVPGEIVYRPGLFGASILIALTAATAALWLASTVAKTWHRAVAALVMAVAICGMHYTAMAGTVLIAGPHTHSPAAVPKELLAAIVTLGVAALVAIGLVMAFLDRRMADRAVLEAARLKSLNLDLEKARAEAEAASEAKTRFLATMSHEIRTPMNGVLGMLEVTLRADLAPEVRDQVGAAHESARRLLQILNDILDFSKMEAGQMSIESLPFSAREEVDSVVSSLRAQAGAKKLTLAVSVDRSLPAWTLGDPTRFRQILINLVGNAIKFTDAGSVSIDLSWIPQEDGGRIRASVQDTGIGIGKETQAQLFARFSQADASTTRRFGGTGLGLAICRELVLAMGGRIAVESEPGRGSLFWFELPTRQVAAPERSAAIVAQDGASRKLRILIAEDNAVNQKVLRAMLGPQGHDLHFVGNGVQAVEAVRQSFFDVVLMDIHMPEMDGPAATLCIRELPLPARAVPIIALTANAMAGDREAYLACGMNDYVSKPVSLPDLKAAIARQSGGASAAERVAPASEARAVSAGVELAEASLEDLLTAVSGKRDQAA
jgi:signal transduction histidine kinase/CheY-like chemotaxis protein